MTASPLRAIADAAQAPPVREKTYENSAWGLAKPKLSILVPTYKYDASSLMMELSALPGAADVETIVYDDGSRDIPLRARLAEAADRCNTPVRIVCSGYNRGRAGARNRALAHARAEWILFLDADMTPDYQDFISAYLGAVAQTRTPAMIIGGYSLRQSSTNGRYALHRWQALASECLKAEERNKTPGRHVFSCNAVVHRVVLDACPFDEGFSGWGWEDTDWGLRVQARFFPIIHIDNTASHLGLDDDEALMAKYGGSGANFARLAKLHPEAIAATPLYRTARLAKALPCRGLFARLARKIASSHRVPVAFRGRALKAWRALIYGGSL